MFFLHISKIIKLSNIDEIHNLSIFGQILKIFTCLEKGSITLLNYNI